MAPPLQGHTLGQRQKFYNELVNAAMEKKILEIPKINFKEDDVDNMIRIDMACKERNVDYILNVFKCEDMLYVSRAINRSTWLITEPQYAHIVNPKHLHSELFPQMNAKAVTKLMLHIRRYLKDEVRVKAFYNYVNERNPKAALRWLGNCPLKFIEKIVAARADEIPMKLLKRLFKISTSIIRVFLNKINYNAQVRESDVIDEIKYLLKTKETAEVFLDILAHCDRFWLQYKLNGKYTHMLMKTSQNKIKELFSKFYEHIDLLTFVKYLKTDEIKSYLMNVSHCNSNWKSFETLAPFLNKLPREEILDFLSALFGVQYVDSEYSNEKDKSGVEALFYEIEGRSYNNFSTIYRWYRFAPFNIAFRDLKKNIFTESTPEERHAMLIVLLSCASNDTKHLETVLEYYHEKHINEPYMHKKTFINSMLSQFYVFRFDDSSWYTLDALFHSSEVYIESTNKVQEALISIIVRNIISNQPVHEMVEEKFEIETLKCFRKELNSDEQSKVFNYLYDLLVKRINLQRTDSETGMSKAIKLLKTVWTLINDWDKVGSHHRFVVDKIAELGDSHKASTWIQEMQKSRRKRRKKKISRLNWNSQSYGNKPDNSVLIDIPSIYKMIKSYRKDLFEKSLILNSSEDVLLNALKHDPGLLTRYKTEIDIMRINDEISLTRFLSKLRIYWLDSLALEWSETNRICLLKLRGHRSLVRGILTLLPHNKTLDFIKMYMPNENKIQWRETNEIELSIQKHIAKNMHIARPQLPAEVVLWYAKGDYLQYALLSLCTMYYNLRSSDIRKYIALILNAPVSVLKHGIRLAFVKYNTNEKIEMAAKSWKKTKNSSIRAILFTLMFDLLCEQKKVMTIKAIWVVISSFIDDLNEAENKTIYVTLGRVSEVPLSVVGDFYQKAYLFLKSVPEKTNVRDFLESILDNAETLIEYLDTEFVEKSLLHSTTFILTHHSGWDCARMYKILSAHLLCSKNLKIQMQKYNNLLQPVLEICIPKWAKGENYLLEGIQCLLGHICSRIPHFVFRKNMKMPVEILRNIRDAILKGSLCMKEHYKMIRRWQLTMRYIETLDEMRNSDEQLSWESIRTASVIHISSMSQNFISEDERTFFPSIYLFFKQVLEILFRDFEIKEIDLLKCLYEMLSEDFSSMYLLVIHMVPNSGWVDHFERWHCKIKRKVYFHPSNEIRMYYFNKFSDKYIEDNNDRDDDDDTED